MEDISPQNGVAEPANDGRGVLTDIPRYAPDYREPLAPRTLPRDNSAALSIFLFALTLLTTTMAGAYTAGAVFLVWHPIMTFPALAAGLSFSIPLMAILLAHEMGHYLIARRYQVNTSPPYFIPAPFPSVFIIGTFGAFIRIREMPRTRRVMFDIGAAGPWAGMIVAVPCVIIGLHLSEMQPLGQGGGGFDLGNSLLFWGISRWMLGVNPALVNVNLHPIAFAGWLGFFVTTLNLIPVGQFDGGHVLYALTPRHHRKISGLFVIGCVLMVIVPLLLGITYWWGWLFWAVLALFLGLGHPATSDREVPLGGRRAIAAWLTVGLFILTFTPNPISLGSPEDNNPQNQSQSYSVMDRTPRTMQHMPHLFGL